MADIKMSHPTPAEEVEAFVESLFGNIATATTATSKGTVVNHFIVAASGSVVWTTDKDTILRKIQSDTAQYALTTNGMTYISLLATGAPAQFGGSSVIVYSNSAVTDNINAFIKAGTKLTFSVSSASVQRANLYFDIA
jgi:hypothetical protein